jgi:hypothetical protein
MLSFGFAVEVDAIPQTIGIYLGFVMLIGSFSVMATFLNDDILSTGLFLVMLVVWALYGVAATFPYKEKNVSYNLLDVVSKNFYGLFLSIYSFTI